MQNTINNLISIINLSYKKNKRKIKVLNSNLIKSFLMLLIKDGIIWGYYIYSNKYLVITLKKFTKYSLSLKFKIYMLNKNAHYISTKKLVHLVNKNTYSTFYLSTKEGFITNKEALKLNIGGKLICKVN